MVPRATENAQQSRACTDLAEDPNLLLSAHSERLITIRESLLTEQAEKTVKHAPLLVERESSRGRTQSPLDTQAASS